MKPKVLEAFTKEEAAKAHRLLAAKVATMMGRKFEEGDWADVYCTAKGIENNPRSTQHVLGSIADGTA